MLRSFFQPSSGGGYKYMKANCAIKEASPPQSTC